MLEICTDKDAALISLAEQRGLLTPQRAQQLRETKGTRSAAVAMVQDGHLDAAVVRALRTELHRGSIDHAIDGYELLGKLGAGGMSVVFKANDLVTRKPVAIKVISPRVAGDNLFLERFHREARAAAAVIHPHVIACYGIGQTKGKAYMVLEYMPGGDLEVLIGNEGGPLGESRALQIAADCASGLEAIHSHGLVHRDVKPSNILLDESGRAKLADLGLAKSTAPDDQLTMPGVRVGSPGYMSPEQAGGQHELDIRSDIYSLGATFYYLLTGQCAFTGRSPLEIIVKSMREDPPPLHQAAPWVSPRVAEIVARCMARRPQDRYQNPAEVRGELLAVLHRSATASSASTALLATQRARRGRSRVRISARVSACLSALWRRVGSWRVRAPG
jgi:serine/threonine-protein kinase